MSQEGPQTPLEYLNKLILTLLLIIPCLNNILQKTVIIVIHSELRDTLHEVDLDINFIMCRSFVVGMDGDWKVMQWAVWAINLLNKINKLTNKIISISNNSVNHSFNANLQMHEHHFRILIPTSASCNYFMSLIDPQSCKDLHNHLKHANPDRQHEETCATSASILDCCPYSIQCMWPT